jgi:hypothetical protein
MFYMLIPLLGMLKSLMFKGANVIDFLKRYKDLCLDYRELEEDRLTRLLQYYI